MSLKSDIAVIFATSVLFIAVLGLQQVDGKKVSIHFAVKNGSETEDSSACPPWFYYDTMRRRCVCFQHPIIKVDVICTENEALLSFGSCMTHDDEEGTTSVGNCVSFLVHNRNVSSYGNYLLSLIHI